MAHLRVGSEPGSIHGSAHGSVQSSNKEPLPIIVRSDPFADLRPFIEYLWTEHYQMCLNVYPDQFPRGIDSGNATKDQEDEFLLRHFTPTDLHLHGGRFLKQALYCIARFNEDSVLDRAARWSQENRSYFEDPSMLMGMCGNVAEIKNFFDAEEKAAYPQAFLDRVIIVIRHGLKQLSEQQAEAANAAKTQSTGNPQQRQTPKDCTNQRSATYFPNTTQTPASGMSGSNRGGRGQRRNSVLSNHENYQRPPRNLPPQPSSAYLSQRQPHLQENHDPLRQVAGNAYTTTSYHPYAQSTRPVAFTSGHYSDMESPFPMPMDYPMTPDAAFISMQAHGEQYTHSPYGVPMVPVVEATPPPRSNGSSYYFRENDPRPVHYQSSSNRSGRGGFFNETRPIDPHSFTRYSDARNPQQRSYPAKNGRRFTAYNTPAQRNRRHSVRSTDDWPPYRERPFEGPARRVYSDQVPKSATSALERNIETSGAMSNSTGYASDPKLLKLSDDPSTWNCTDDHIGSSRIDVRSLVVGNIPHDVPWPEFEDWLRREVNCTKMDFGKPSSGLRIVFLNFHTSEDARRALWRKTFYFRGIEVVFKVPWKYSKPTHPEYVSAENAKAWVLAGCPPQQHRPLPSNTHCMTHSNVPSSFARSDGSRGRVRTMSSAGTSMNEDFSRSDRPFSARAAVTDHASSSATNTAPVVSQSEVTPDTDAKSPAAPALVEHTENEPSISEASTPRKTKNRNKNKKPNGSAHLSQEAPFVQSDIVAPSLRSRSNSHTGSNSQHSGSVDEDVQQVTVEGHINDSPINEAPAISRATSQDRRDFTDEIDESFQTAVETPESNNQVASGSSSCTLDGIPLIVGGSNLSSPTTSRDVDIQKDVTMEGVHHPSLPIEGKVSTTLRTGPKQTESLSPFARQSQRKKKDTKQKSVKEKCKSKLDDLSQTPEIKKDDDVGTGTSKTSVKIRPFEKTIAFGTVNFDLTSNTEQELDKAKALGSHLQVVEELEMPEQRAKEKIADAPVSNYTSTSDAVTDPAGQLHEAEYGTNPMLSKIKLAFTGALSSKRKSENTSDAKQVTSEGAEESTNDHSSRTLGLKTDSDTMAIELSQPLDLETSQKPDFYIFVKSKAASRANVDTDLEHKVQSPAPITTKKPKKKKKSKAKKSTSTAPARSDDVSSSGTLTHTTNSPAKGNNTSVSSERPNTSATTLQHEVTRLVPDSVSHASHDLFGFSLAGAGMDSLMGPVNEQVEQSRLKLKAMEEKERQFKLKQKRNMTES